MNLSAGMKSFETIHAFVCMVILSPTFTFGIQYKLKPLLMDNYNLHVSSELILAFMLQLWTCLTNCFDALPIVFMGLELNRYTSLTEKT